MTKNIEVELKFPLNNSNDLKLKLDISKSTKREYQKDTYFVPPHNNYLEQKPISEWLRLREGDKGASINHKHWHNYDGEKTVSCDELESKVDDGKALHLIFEKLGFKEIIIVEKLRETWLIDDVEIAIDEVTNLGCFIELESKGNFETIEDAKNHLYQVLEKLGADVGTQDFKGYPALILEKNGLL